MSINSTCKLRDNTVTEELLIPDTKIQYSFYILQAVLLELFPFANSFLLFPLIPDTKIQYFNTRGLFRRFKLTCTMGDLGSVGFIDHVTTNLGVFMIEKKSILLIF